MAEFDEELWYATVDHVAVYEDKRMVFTFRDHTQVEVPADRWKADSRKNEARRFLG